MNPNQQGKIDALNERITTVVVEAIQTGIATGNWSPPWLAGPNIWSPSNPITGRRYTGGNRFYLALTASMYGYGQHWATYDQWASLSRHAPACVESRQTATVGKLRKPNRDDCERHGCELVHVIKGEKGHPALRPIMRKIRGEDGIEREQIVGFAPYTVFAANQVANYDEPKPVTVTHDGDMQARFDEADLYAAAVGADVQHVTSEGASFIPARDIIEMPAHDRWHDAADYWSTLVHEMIHWTGHPDRLDRPGVRAILEQTSTKESYGFEELVAELGCAFHLAHLGMTPTVREDHMQYLAGWLTILNADSTALWKAAAKAEAASKMLGRKFGIAQPATEEVTAA